MILTYELFQKGKSSNNGWNNQQLKALGISNPTKGWAKKIIGKDLPEESINKFLELKDCHFRNKNKDYIERKKIKNIFNGNLPIFSPCSNTLSYKDQYTHPNWQKMRLYILSRDNFTCVNCLNQDRTLHAHHLKYKLKSFIWDVPTWYIVTLCDICHSREHNKDLVLK